MSETDSFIDEVSEEVRRDRLFGYLRRYGWIAVLAILALVGAAAWSEWSKSQAEVRAEALGDALIDALETPDAAESAAALAAIEATGPARAVTAMLTAAELEEAGDIDAALSTLNSLAANEEVPQIYRDLARLKALIAGEGVMDAAERRAGLEALAVPGQPFRMPALEQLALATLASGDTDAALGALQMLIEDAETSDGLRDRAENLIVALGMGTAAPDAAAEPAQAETTPAEIVPAEDSASVPPGEPDAQDAAVADEAELAPQAVDPATSEADATLAEDGLSQDSAVAADTETPATATDESASDAVGAESQTETAAPAAEVAPQNDQ